MTTASELLCGADPTERDSPQRALVLTRPLFGCAACVANCVLFHCGLKLATRCTGSGASLEGLLCRPRSAVASDWSGATC